MIFVTFLTSTVRTLYKIKSVAALLIRSRYFTAYSVIDRLWARAVCLCVCLSVTALAATAFVSACNQRHLRHSFRLFLD